MSSFFKQLFPFMKVKKKKEFSYIIKDVDPNSVWEIVGELGDGSFGKVYKAQHKTDGILAAAKIIDVNDENELEDFMVEIDILSEVKHKHIVGLHQTYYYYNKLWMMLEFCQGGALDDLMLDVLVQESYYFNHTALPFTIPHSPFYGMIITEIERGLTEPEIKAICYQLFEGLNILHNNKVIHRDLKAGNLLLASDGNIKMADFGVSAKNKKTLQRRTTFIGTPYWMAPEVVVTETCKDDPYDYKADIWSAGVTIIELAQMVPPYHAMHPMRVLFKIPKADPPTLENSNKWSKDLRDFLASCVVKSPEMRSTAAELLKHPFLANGVDFKTLKDLYNEAKAEVIEVIEDLPEDTEEKDNDERLKSSGSFEYLLDEEKENEKEKEKEKEDEKKEGEDEVFEDKKIEEPKKEEEKVEDVVKKEEETEDVSKEGERAEEVPKPEQEDEDKKEPEETPKTEEEKPVEKEEEKEEKKEDKEPEESKEEKEAEPSKEETTEEVTEKKDEDEGEKEAEPSEAKTTDEVTEKKDDDKGEKEAADKYSSRLDNILDEMEDTDEKPKEKEEEKKEEEQEKEAAKEQEGASHPEEDTTKPTESEEEKKENGKEEKEMEEKEEEEEEGQINKDGLKEVPIYIDEGEDKTENKEDNKKQEESEPSSSPLREIPIYTDDGDVPIENKDNKKITEETATDGKKMTNGAAILAAELGKGSVLKKEGEDGKTGEKHFKTLKRTRKFATEDGKIVTETTSRVVDVSGEDFKNALLKEQQQRKMNLRDMKVFQRQEQKQGMELMSKIRRQWEAQEQRFEQEIQDIEKKFEGDLENLSRNQKREIEKLELSQNADLRASSRKMKQDQEKELRKFKDNLKEEGKKSKKDIDKLPRPVRKETWKKKKDELDVSHRQAEHEFLAMQQTEFEKFYKQMIDLHRQKMFEMEMQFLESKHERKRSHESEKWEMEYRHLNERHQLAKTQLKETFFLQRSQMLNRHQKEVEQHQHLTKLQEDEMKRRHEIERKRLPKIQRNEIKVKAQNYRKTLRDKKVTLEQEKDLMREFEEEERKRARSEYEKMLLRQDLEAEELKNSSEAALKELQQLQNEKRHMLMESETLKLKERDDKHSAQMMAWKAELGPRKKSLEEEFAREKREQQLFYARGGEAENQPPNDLRVPSDRDSMDGSGGSQTGSQKTPDDTSSSTGSLEV